MKKISTENFLDLSTPSGLLTNYSIENMSSFADSAFAGAGQSVGLELWRVENKEVVKQASVSTKWAFPIEPTYENFVDYFSKFKCSRESMSLRQRYIVVSLLIQSRIYCHELGIFFSSLNDERRIS